MPGPLTRSIASILKDAVEERGLTQMQVAEVIGQSQSQVSKYLRGEVVMDAEEIYKICRLVGVSIVDLFATAEQAVNSETGNQ